MYGIESDMYYYLGGEDGHQPIKANVMEGFMARAQQVIEQLAERKTSTRRGSVRGSFGVGIVDANRLGHAVVKSIEQNTRRIVLEDDEQQL